MPPEHEVAGSNPAGRVRFTPLPRRMKEPRTESQSEPDGRIPRPALAVAVFGLLLSALIYGISLRSGGGSAELEWDVVEPVKAAKVAKLGPDGSVRLARTTVSALAPKDDGSLVFRIAGVVTIDSGGPDPTTLRCDVATTNGGDSMIARTSRKRAAWPRPSDELQRQEVPELAVVKFNTHGAVLIGLPIRDAFRRYTDSAAPTLVDWAGYEEKSQNWLWTMEQGTGSGSATLGYAVYFRTDERPEGEINCRAKSAPASGPAAAATLRVPVRLATWPIPEEPVDAQTGSQATNVE